MSGVVDDFKETVFAGPRREVPRMHSQLLWECGQDLFSRSDWDALDLKIVWSFISLMARDITCF